MKIWSLLLPCICLVQTKAGEFINLDFESANDSAVVGQVSPNGYLVGIGPAKDLAPGWYSGGVITFNGLTDICFGAPCMSIHCRESFVDTAPYLLGRMTGNYAFVFDVGGGGGYSVKLSQRGDIPLGATALDLQIVLPGARVEVRLDGMLVYERNLLDPPRIQDISAFAGKTVDLEILFLQAVSPGRTGGGLDKVRFAMGPTDMDLRILKTPFFNDPPQHLTLQFTAVMGREYIVEYRESLGPESSWQPLPGNHQGGLVSDIATSPQRFYRVRLVE